MIDVKIVTFAVIFGGPGRRDRLGPDHLVLRPADQLVARAASAATPARRWRRPASRRSSRAAGPRRSSSSSCRRSSGWRSGLLLMTSIFWIFRWTPPSRVDRWFRRLQLRVGGGLQPEPRRQRRAEDDGHHRRRAAARPATSRRSTFRSGSCWRRTRRSASARWPAAGASSTRWGRRSRSCSRSAASPPRPARRVSILIGDADRRPRQHHARHHRRHRRRRRDAAPVGRALGRGRADRLGVGADHSRRRSRSARGAYLAADRSPARSSATFVTWRQIATVRPARQLDRERRAAFGPVLGAHRAAVQFHQVLDDRQSEAGAARIARARLVDAIEPLEHARQIVVRESRARRRRPRSRRDRRRRCASTIDRRSAPARRCWRCRPDCGARRAAWPDRRAAISAPARRRPARCWSPLPRSPA